MKLTISSQNKLQKIITIFKSLNKVSENVNIHANSERLYIQGKCSINVCIAELNLTREWFDTYECDETVVLGINCEILFKIMSCINDNQTMHISHDGTDKMFIEFKGDNTIEKSFEVSLIDIDTDVLDLPYKEHMVDIKIGSSVYNELITQMKMFGEEATFTCSQTDVKLTTTSVSGTSNIILNEDNLVEYGIEEDASVVSSFSLNYLHIVSLFSRITSNIAIHLSENFPIEFRFIVEKDWMDEDDDEDEDENDEDELGISKQNILRFFIAPKIDDE